MKGREIMKLTIMAFQIEKVFRSNPIVGPRKHSFKSGLFGFESFRARVVQLGYEGEGGEGVGTIGVGGMVKTEILFAPISHTREIFLDGLFPRLIV